MRRLQEPSKVTKLTDIWCHRNMKVFAKANKIHSKVVVQSKLSSSSIIFTETMKGAK
jgi:hypothetical protein